MTEQVIGDFRLELTCYIALARDALLLTLWCNVTDSIRHSPDHCLRNSTEPGYGGCMIPTTLDICFQSSRG
jgi:hypothetical protein